MRPLHHRDPGLAGIALADRRVAACLIVDGIHVDPIALRLAFAAAGPRAVAVTDSVAIAGLDDGATAEFGGAPAILRDGAARRPDGSLCGAAITLDEGLRRLLRFGIAPEAALLSATEAPAQAIGLADRGRIAAGRRADLVWFDDDFSVREVWVAGTPVRGTAPAPQPTRRSVALPLTEVSRPDLADLDSRDEDGIIAALLAQERRAQDALADARPSLAALARAIAGRLDDGGRLFYVGAGTSGRLAVLDAVECGPTFSLPPGIIVPILAGGASSMTEAVEGAEDDQDAARAAIAEHNVSIRDIVVGIAASGRTGFVLAALQAARVTGAATGAIVNAPGGPIETLADFPVLLATGPEAITGSTRLSAGTTQKIALNALSTTAMIRLGKTFGPLMVDVRATNAKLRDRAARIVASLAGCTMDESAETLEACGFEVKTAIVMRRLDLGAEAARRLLDAARGRLRHVLDAPAPPP
jgi:N-acetylmuramic acid 6-phosphate etherase